MFRLHEMTQGILPPPVIKYRISATYAFQKDSLKSVRPKSCMPVAHRGGLSVHVATTDDRIFPDPFPLPCHVPAAPLDEAAKQCSPHALSTQKYP